MIGIGDNLQTVIAFDANLHLRPTCHCLPHRFFNRRPELQAEKVGGEGFPSVRISMWLRPV